MTLLQKTAPVVNRAVRPLLRLPLVGTFVGRSLAELEYTGRRSGRAFRLVVGHRRRGDRVTIQVALPDQKSWWRNFTGTGAPLSLVLDGVRRTGHAVSATDARGRVTVQVELDPA